MAWTTPKTWSVGEVLTAANMNLHLRDNLNFLKPEVARKTADQGVSSTTYVDVTGFSFAVAASEVWIIQIDMDVDINGTSKVKFLWSVPSGATGQQRYLGDSAGSATAAIGSDLITSNGGSATFPLAYSATLVNSTNAGTAQFRMALFTGVNTATLKANSGMQARRV